MNDLISREAAIEQIKHSDVCVFYMRGMSGDEIARRVIDATKRCIVTDLEQLPTIDPVKHGRWIDDSQDGKGMWFLCSECGESAPEVEPWDYCPNCGAKMDGGEDV